MESFSRTMDETHSRLERNILEQTVRFDNFFGSVSGDNLRQQGYEIRWRNNLRIDHGSDLTYGTGLRASFTLSRISERLRLVIAREGETDNTRQSLPQDPGNPGFDRTTPTTHFTNTELRYNVIDGPDMNLFLGAGVRVKLPFEAFVRSRFQYTRHFDDISLMRFGETLFLKNTSLLGETTEISLERLYKPGTILRWATAGTASQEIEGLEWGTEFSYIQEFSPRSAITVTGGVYGNTTSSLLNSNYHIFARYRQNFLRKWLFYELEPEISWQRNEVGRYPAILAFTLRLEIVFQGKAAPKEKISGLSPSPRKKQPE
jgi:hypothetical protein